MRLDHLLSKEYCSEENRELALFPRYAVSGTGLKGRASGAPFFMPPLSLLTRTVSRVLPHDVRDATDLELRCYLAGASRDGTRSDRHNTFRFGQKDRRWLDVLACCLAQLGHRSWCYREGRTRSFWVLETTAPILEFQARGLGVGSRGAAAYVRGYFDADGGIPGDERSRMYIQFTQKDRADLSVVHRFLADLGIRCGRLHRPSRRVAPEYWRFYVAARSIPAFLDVVGSWHPGKREILERRGPLRTGVC